MITSDPNSPTAFANARATPDKDPGQDRGQDDPAERRPAAGAEGVRGLLELGIDLDQQGLHGSDHERKRHEEQAERDRRPRVRDVDTDRRLRPVEREQRQSRDDRRQGEREVDDGVDHALAAELVTDEHPRGQRPEHGVQERHENRGDERELERGDRLRVRDRVPERLRALASRFPDERRHRQQDEDREKGRDKAEGQGRCGPVPRVRPATRRRCRERLSRCRHRPASRCAP